MTATDSDADVVWLYEPPPLPPEIVSALRDLFEEAARDLPQARRWDQISSRRRFTSSASGAVGRKAR